MKLNKTLSEGFTLIEFMITIVVLVVLAFILLPRHTGHKASATRINCYNNLRQVSWSYRQWAIDHGDKFPMEVSLTNGGAMEAALAGDVVMVFRVMSNELNTPKILFCPTDKRRIRANTFETAPAKSPHQLIPFLSNSNISYFAGLDVNPTTPQMFLSGDDNLLISGAAAKPGTLSLWTNTPVAWSDKRHEKAGNVGLADGSVQGFSSSKLAEALRNTGMATNRLVFP